MASGLEHSCDLCEGCPISLCMVQHIEAEHDIETLRHEGQRLGIDARIVDA